MSWFTGDSTNLELLFTLLEQPGLSMQMSTVQLLVAVNTAASAELQVTKGSSEAASESIMLAGLAFGVPDGDYEVNGPTRRLRGAAHREHCIRLQMTRRENTGDAKE